MRIAIAEARTPEPSISVLATIPICGDDSRQIAGLVIDQLCAVASKISEQGRGCVITWEIIPWGQPSDRG